MATANVSKVYFSGRMFLNHAAVNPLFSFLSTLSDGDDALYEYEFFPEPERAAIFEPLRGDLPAGIGPTRCCAPDGRTSCCSWSKASAARRSTSVSEANP